MSRIAWPTRRGAKHDGWPVELWYTVETIADRIWELLGHDRVTYWLDPFPAWIYRHRKAAERRSPQIRARLR